MNVNPMRNDFAKNYLKVSNKAAAKPRERQDSAPPQDSVEVSPLASFRQKVSEAQDLTRQEQLKRIAEDVESGNYVTEEKLDSALGSAIESALNGL